MVFRKDCMPGNPKISVDVSPAMQICLPGKQDTLLWWRLMRNLCSMKALLGMERNVRISDLVWCKDMGQPWWPGKVIGDSILQTDSDESFESDIYMVACFGDRSTAWHHVSCVKPFWENFPRLAKRSDIGNFRRVVDSAREEVSRQTKYTLTCRCLPKQIHADVGRPFWGVGCEDK